MGKSSKRVGKSVKRESESCYLIIVGLTVLSFFIGVLFSILQDESSVNIRDKLTVGWKFKSNHEKRFERLLLKLDNDIKRTVADIELMSTLSVENPTYFEDIRKKSKSQQASPKRSVSKEYVPPKRSYVAKPSALADIVSTAIYDRSSKGTTYSYFQVYGSVRTNGTYFKYLTNFSDVCEVLLLLCILGQLLKADCCLC